MSTPSEDDLRGALASVLLKDGGDEGVVDGIDGDIIEYLAGMLAETEMDDVEESVGPFLEGYGCDETLIRSCCDAVTSIGSVGSGGGPSSSDMHVVNGSRDDVPSDGPAKLKQGVVSMSAALTDQTEDELDAQRYMWGQENRVAAMTNAQRDAHDSTVSAKDRRKARKELEAARREYEARMAVLQAQEEGDAGKASVSNMIIPDYRSGRNEKDIHVRNVSLSLDNGTCLLDDGELKFAHRRRYGLVGKNGVVSVPRDRRSSSPRRGASFRSNHSRDRERRPCSRPSRHSRWRRCPATTAYCTSGRRSGRPGETSAS